MNTTGHEPIGLTFFGEDGEILHLTDFEVQPFSYADLERAASGGPATEFTILRNVKILREDGSEVSSERQRARIDGPTYPSFLVALVIGGWLPAVWVAQDHLMLLDSNVFTHLTGRYRKGSIKDQGSPDLSDLFVHVPIRVHCLLSALEGERRVPTVREAVDNLAQARTRLAKALPLAIVHPKDEDAIRGVMGFIQDVTRSAEAEIRFIRACAPKVARSPNPEEPPPWSSQERIGILREVLAEAEGLTPHSTLCVLALLGCLVGPCGNAAIKLIKPNDIHDDGDAYNAWFDLQSLRVLIALSADEPQTRMAIVTGDRGMARFWAALGVHDARADGMSVNFNVTPNPSLFAFSDEEWATVDRWLRR